MSEIKKNGTHQKENLANKGSNQSPRAPRVTYRRDDLEQDYTFELERVKTAEFSKFTQNNENKALQNRASSSKKPSSQTRTSRSKDASKKRYMRPSRDGSSFSQKDLSAGMTRVISRVSESVSSKNKKRKSNRLAEVSERIKRYRQKNSRKTKRLFLRVRRSAVGRFFSALFAEKSSAKMLKKSKAALFFEKLSAFCYSNRVALFMKRLYENICFCGARAYGIFFFTFGMFSSLGYLGANLFSLPYSDSLSSLILGLILVVFSIPLLISSRSIAYVIENSVITGAFFYSFLGMRSHNRKEEIEGGFFLALSLGLFFGALGFFVSPYKILGILLIALFVGCVFASSEFGITVTVLCLPFMTYFRHPTIIICSIIILCHLSYIRKLLLNKRSFSLTPCDLFVFIFMLFYLGGGIVSFANGNDSRNSALVFLVIISIYFLASNLLINRRTIGKVLNIVLFSGFLVSLVAIYQQTSGNITADWLDLEAYSYISGRITSTFDNPNVFGSYIIMVIPLVFVNTKDKLTPLSFITRFICLSALVSALVFTWSRGAWLGAIVAMTALLIFAFRKSPRILVALFAFIPNLLLFLPRSVTSRFSSIFSFLDGNIDSSISYRFTVWKDSLSLFADNLFGGVGVGSDAFKAAFLGYSSMGAEAAEHSHNLFLEIGIELGIFALIAFFFILLFTCRNCFSVEFSANETSARPICSAAFCGILALLVNGLFDYVWYNYRVCLMFWLLLGICNATYRIGTAEQRQIDYRASLVSNIASTDIQIRK